MTTVVLEGFTAKTSPAVQRVCDGLFRSATSLVTKVTVTASVDPSQGAIGQYIFSMGDKCDLLLARRGDNRWLVDQICHSCKSGTRWVGDRLECGGCGLVVDREESPFSLAFWDSEIPDFYEELQTFVYRKLPHVNVLKVALEAETFASMMKHGMIIAHDFAYWVEDDRWRQFVGSDDNSR